MLFHLKNVMTHAAPRGGQPTRVGPARSHQNALIKLLGFVPPPPPAPPFSTKKMAKVMASPMAPELLPDASGAPSPSSARNSHPPLSERRNSWDPSCMRAVSQSAVTTEALSFGLLDDAPSAAAMIGAALPAPFGAAEHFARNPPTGAINPEERQIVPKNTESVNFAGHDASGRYIVYRGMRLPFTLGQLLMVRRLVPCHSPPRNVKFLGNLTGSNAEVRGVLGAAQERASAAGLILSVFSRYDELHLMKPGGLDSNHCAGGGHSLDKGE
jgi:hypothetical protein